MINLEGTKNRKEFLSAAVKACACCGAASLLQAETGSAVLAANNPNGAVTQNEKKIEFAHQWIRRFMDILDNRLDEDTRKNIMEENGQGCFRGIHGDLYPSAPRPDFDRWIAERQKIMGKKNIWREGNTIYFNYVQNRNGLQSPNEHCLCPLIEDGLPKLSATYCYCSVGYVHELFHRIIREPLEVELLSSLYHGDRNCRFRVQIKS
jgi:hypothetical protein